VGAANEVGAGVLGAPVEAREGEDEVGADDGAGVGTKVGAEVVGAPN
jgi:hypothetical protein